MRQLFFFLFSFIFLSSCTNFYHLKYSKLRKVPATGFVAATEIDQEQASTQKQNKDAAPCLRVKIIPIPKKYDSTVVIPENKEREKCIIAKKTLQKQNRISIQKRSSTLSRKNHQQKRKGSGFLVLLLIILCLILFLFGLGILIVGIFAIIWWLILIGLALIFIGLIPLLEFIGFIFGDRNRQVPLNKKEQQYFRSFFG